jgi:hypothetical protein
MRKIVFAVCSVVTFLGMVISATSAGAASSAVTCSGSNEYYLININAGWGWSSGSSPYTVYEHDTGSETAFCRTGSNPDYHFVQYGTSRCLYIKTSNRTIIEGNCADAQADWHQINLRSVVGLEEVELQSEVNLACIYERGVNSTFTYNPCNSSNDNDQWLFP